MGRNGRQPAAKIKLDKATGKVLVTEPGVLKLDLLGTAEAASMLDVERPRIGRWLKSGVMPQPFAKTASGPVWLRQQIVAMRRERESRRRPAAVAQ